ncbi:unnamed protein product [Soboliphyme baturini]|uniref:Lipoprotein n=1 Tax=Soboliphyme baturini TaxID=241478 RepID=A0A183JBC9_9BILA|nr:unnamed protein product [Soboliphyme baturini]
MYSIFLGLGSWSVWQIDNNQPDVQQNINLLPAATIRTESRDTVIVFDTYFDSLGLYTEELKYSQAGKVAFCHLKHVSCRVVSSRSIDL